VVRICVWDKVMRIEVYGCIIAGKTWKYLLKFAFDRQR